MSPPALMPRSIEIPVPERIASVLVHPDLEVSTADARNRLAREYSMEDWLTQQGFLAGFLMGIVQDDHELIAACLKDVIIERQRRQAVPGFDAVKSAALDAGAFGASLSGSGPSMFALCPTDSADRVATAMQQACAAAGHECQAWVSPLAAPGAHLTEDEA